ncbi:SDR family oxidoreductase [Aquabacterium fontiphilum]|jgi:NAD(P)-dependent dehydrogenase (short-subunit alcohol dehydrogenase family)|uniref:SDR family oxidoreductase n=1 Tax=Aquabacterium fontiphilum TaxID=450365 RepID=UPI001378B6EE|nr:SDR family oxidoreductase [Aquabacterium fontiphilum]NBD19241.1 SDR family oxidoreductase [Aquabacterium fontiphilum]
MHPAQAPALFVTGAAAGIGRAVAERFAAQGWFVGLWDIDEAGVLAVQRGLGGAATVAGRLDVTQPEDWDAALRRFTDAAGGRLDVLLNNAGIAVTSPFEAADLARHHRLIDINLKGVVNGCHAAALYLRRTPGSRVINMCSASALYGQPELASYSATKAAVRSLTEALDIEWQRHGVRVVDVLPLFVNTAMVADEVSRMKTVQTLGVRLGPEDVAEAVWRLANMAAARMPVHTHVGWQTKLFALLSKLSPSFMNRVVTARMAGY